MRTARMVIPIRIAVAQGRSMLCSSSAWKAWLVLALILGIIVGCRGQGKQEAAPEATPDWALLSPAEGKRLARSSSLGSVVHGSWSPSSADVLRVEAKLAQLLVEECRRLPRGNHEVNLTSYYRQYAGVLRGASHVVIVVGFVKKIGEFRERGWRQTAVAIGDGGQSVFATVYDIAEDQFTWFRFNGPLVGETPAPER